MRINGRVKFIRIIEIPKALEQILKSLQARNKLKFNNDRVQINKK